MGGGVSSNEKIKYRLPESLRNPSNSRSWVSGGWTTPGEVHPVNEDTELELVVTMINELNSMHCLGLDNLPSTERLTLDPQENPLRFLMIGSSHARREGEALADRGHEVITCSSGGWRPNVTAAKEMAARVQDALRSCNNNTVAVVHGFDNIAYMSRTEEGGILPIRKYEDKHHVDGELILASKERILMYFKNCLPFLRLLENMKVIFLTPLPRYLYNGCCASEDHLINRGDEDFKDSIRGGLQEVRGYFKDFLFTNGLRGFSVRNPGHAVPAYDDAGSPLWTEDPVHPAFEGYNRIADLIEVEARSLLRGNNKRRGGRGGPPNKRARFDHPRPDWISRETGDGGARGGGGGGVTGGGRARGRGGYHSRPGPGRRGGYGSWRGQGRGGGY
jgi:hypothetical protein